MGKLLSKIKMTSRPKLRILCFGDSLTAGYASWGAVHHPYNGKMEEMLSMAFPDLTIETEEDGVSGATVKSGFQTRMNAQFMSKTKRKDGEKPYDWAVVLGGTNDIGMGFPPEAVFESLKAVWEVPLSNGCKVLALTVPEAGITGAFKARIDDKRTTLNDLIRGYKRENFHVYDLNKSVTYFSMSEPDRARYWDDLIHFTPDGYDLIGHKVGMALVSLLARDTTHAPTRPQRRQRVFRGDDKAFDEEADGDHPWVIDRGYVVVRWKDLE